MSSTSDCNPSPTVSPTSTPKESQHIQATSGLANYGNFCYLNASIQCLRVLEPFVQYFNECNELIAVINDLLKKFDARDVNKLARSKRLFRTVAFYLDKHYTDNPNPEDPYENPDTGSVVALEDIYGKDPPSQLISAAPHILDNTIKMVIKIKDTHHLSRQQIYNIIRKLALHLEKVYLFIVLHSTLISMELAGMGRASQVINPREVIITLNLATKDTIEYSHLCNGQQNDASELITVLLDFLHEACAYPTDMNISPRVLELTPAEIAEMNIKEQIQTGICQSAHRLYSRSYTSMVNRMFFFTLQVIRCGNEECDAVSLSYPPDNTLSIPIYIEDLAKKVADSAAALPAATPWQPHMTGGSHFPMTRATAAAMHLRQTTLLEYRKMGNRRQIELAAEPISIYNCLNEYFKTDYLDDYKCEKCNNKEGNHISRALVNLPRVLIISLKRFQTIDNQGRRAKVYRRVTYPAMLDISKYLAVPFGQDVAAGENIPSVDPDLQLNDDAASTTSSPEDNPYYRLIGVNLHSGGVDGGHYTAMTYNKHLGKWFMYNDEHVHPLHSPSDALNHPNAYILFYEQI